MLHAHTVEEMQLLRSSDWSAGVGVQGWANIRGEYSTVGLVILSTAPAGGRLTTHARVPVSVLLPVGACGWVGGGCVACGVWAVGKAGL